MDMVRVCVCVVRHFVVRDAAPTKTLAGLPLRHNTGEGNLIDGEASDSATEKKLLAQQGQAGPDKAHIEREQLERMRQRFGAHDGL